MFKIWASYKIKFTRLTAPDVHFLTIIVSELFRLILEDFLGSYHSMQVSCKAFVIRQKFSSVCYVWDRRIWWYTSYLSLSALPIVYAFF